MAQKLDAKGAIRSTIWDDLADHDNVTKIYVQGGREGIQYVKFDYVKNGQPQTGSIHGHCGIGFTQTFEIDPNNEYLVSVEGYYDGVTGVIQALKFHTNRRTSEMIGYDDKGSKFSLEVDGKKIIGFHGYAGTYLNSLGAYFTTTPPKPYVSQLIPSPPPVKLDYQGGSGGKFWDDGPNYNGVRKVSFTLGNNEIRQIRFDYDKGGQVETREHGENQGQQEEFVIDYPTEYIIAVEGTCDIVSDPTQNRVRSLAIKTSKGRISPIFGNVAARKFVLQSKGCALIGFHGRAAGAVDAIGAYASLLIPTPPPTTKLDYQGGSGGNFWDDGPNYDGVRKVSFTLGKNEIRQIRFDYDRGGLVVTQEHGENDGRQEEFVIDYPTEYIIAVEGTCDIVSDPTQNRIRSLTIKTSKGRTSPIFGNVSARKFVLESKGGALIGFHGRAAGAIDAIGAYVSLLIPSRPPTKLDYQGGSGGNFWDDGLNYDGVRKVSFTLGKNEIRQIRFDYDRGGLVVTREHGENDGRQEEFVIDYPTEYITAVEGTCDIVSDPTQNRVRSLTIKTSNGRSSPIFGNVSAQKFVLESKGSAFIGFHGRAAGAVDAIGAYVSLLIPSHPPTKLAYQGGSGGKIWDDGPNYNGVRKVTLTLEKNEIRQIQFDYDKGGLVERREHGENQGRQEEFVIDYPSEYIISMEGTCDIVCNPTQNRVRSLSIKTSKGRHSPIFGNLAARKFVLESKGCALIGFHGRAGGAVDAIGAYVSLLTHSPSPTKLDYQGGSGGKFWDDGPIYNGVRKVSFTLGKNEIRQIRFDYDRGGLVVTREHGENDGRQEEFVIDYPNEYIIAVEGTCDIVSDPAQNRVRSLAIKTSKGRISPIFGNVAAKKFMLESKGSAIIGFHGRAAGAVDAIGAYVSMLIPSPPPTKLDYQGGSGGKIWDDGPIYNGVIRVSFTLGKNEIRQIRFDYDRGGLVVTREHGENDGRLEEFVIDYPTEYIIAVEGTSDIVSDPTQNRVRSLTIKTSKGRISPIFGNVAARKFVLESKGSAIIGFHGRAAGAVDAIGAYTSSMFPSPPLTKLDYHGGSGGKFWDDGPNYNGVRKVSFTLGKNEIRQIRFDYDSGGLVVTREHGENDGRQEEFVIDYPTEYIIAVEGTCDIVSDPTQNRVRSLTIKTSKGRSSPIFGNVSARKFVLESKGSVVVGFHGRAAGALDAIGVYTSLLIPSSSPTKLDYQGVSVGYI